ncbi:putative ribosomal protein S5 [Septoria linicola]|nr:putative ribosomal protein S5 [Septoria linicola]
MSTSKAYQCLSCRLKKVSLDATNTTSRRAFSTTPAAQRRFRNNVRPSPTQPQREHPEADGLRDRLRPYTAREKKLLALKYTPEQMEAIEAGEQAIPSEDMVTRGRFRTDPMRLDYIDDFATVRPVVDATADQLKEMNSTQLQEGDQSTLGAALSSSKPKRDKGRKEDQEEQDPHMLRLSQQTGLSKDEIRKIRVKNLVTHRVVNQTRMGKIQSLYFLTIAGNQNGMLGIGEGKAAEDEDGRRQAMMNAIRNMKPIPRYEERTIFGEVEGKVGASIVKLSARPPGFGNRCQHLIFELARAAGISDLAARTPRSRNKMNVVKAAFEALTNQRLPEDVAKARGKKMVDVRGVYYGGLVH